MRLNPSFQQSGLSLIELLVAMAIVAVLATMALPAYGRWIQNSQIRAQAEAMSASIQQARSLAISQNRPISIFFVDSIGAGCALTANGPDWVVSSVDPSTQCDALSRTSSEELVFRPFSGQDGGSKVRFSATANGGEIKSARFNGTGRLAGSVGGLTLDFFSRQEGTCEHEGGDFRCLRVEVNASGSVRTCDPKIKSKEDPRSC